MPADNPFRAAPGVLRQATVAVLEGLGVPVAERSCEALLRLLSETSRWAERVDLTAPRSVAEFVDLTLADAAILAREELRRGAPSDALVDVGSGGGAPGVPLALLLSAERPELRLTLVEPRAKRVAFLRSLVGVLELSGVTVVRSRSDSLSAGSFDVALARATLPPPAWVEEGARLARRAVWLLLAREPLPPLPGWEVGVDLSYQWPLTGARRRAVRLERRGESPPGAAGSCP
jgi:16S rRNA (guanine527-N7)-methyltransferase